MKIKKTDCHNLDIFLAKIIYKSLKKYKKHTVSVPMFLENKYNGDSKKAAAEWNKILDKMIWAFRELYRKNDIDVVYQDDEHYKKWLAKVNKGKKLFVKHFERLWD